MKLIFYTLLNKALRMYMYTKFKRFNMNYKTLNNCVNMGQTTFDFPEPQWTRALDYCNDPKYRWKAHILSFQPSFDFLQWLKRLNSSTCELR